MNFYDEISQHIADEAKDNKKYMALAASAPTDKAKRILTDIAHEEERHKEFLQEILASDKSNSEKATPAEAENITGHNASDEINSTDHSESTGMIKTRYANI